MNSENDATGKPLTRSGTRSPWGLFGLLLVLAIGAAAWQAYDEVRLRSIRLGMIESDVVDRLGAAPHVIPAELFSRSNPDECQAREAVARWALYSRILRPGLLLGFDREGRIVCVVRTRLRIIT